eukprot:Colp12_sorted_trinity150504_noHs@1959
MAPAKLGWLAIGLAVACFNVLFVSAVTVMPLHREAGAGFRTRRALTHPNGSIATLSGGVTQILYYTTLVINGETYKVQVDTGSSDFILPVKNQCKAYSRNVALNCQSSTTQIDASLVGKTTYPCLSLASQGKQIYYAPSTAALTCNGIPCFCNNYGTQDSQSWSYGGVYLETITWGGVTASNVAIGGAHGWTIDFEPSSVDGILGVAGASLSTIFQNSQKLPVIDTMATQGLIANSFTMCFGSSSSGSSMVLGGVLGNSSAYKFTPFSGSQWYKVTFSGMQVPGSGSLAEDNTLQMTIVDSGTTLLVGPTNLLTTLVQQICAASTSPCTNSGVTQQELLAGLTQGPSIVRFTMNDQQVAMFPSINIYLQGLTLTIPPTNYLARVPGTNQVMFGFSSSGATTGGPLILGDVVLQGYSVFFDRQNHRIGFALAPANCNDAAYPGPNDPSAATSTAPISFFATLFAAAVASFIFNVHI